MQAQREFIQMKPIFFCLVLTILSSCTTSTPHKVQITLGEPARKVQTDPSSLADYESVEFPVCLTNASNSPVWIYAQFRELPFYNVYIRDNPNSHWKNETTWRCGVGNDFHRLEPGESISSTVWAPADSIGHQLRVEIQIYAVPDYKAKPLNAVSEAIPIR